MEKLRNWTGGCADDRGGAVRNSAFLGAGGGWGQGGDVDGPLGRNGPFPDARRGRVDNTSGLVRPEAEEVQPQDQGAVVGEEPHVHGCVRPLGRVALLRPPTRVAPRVALVSVAVVVPRARAAPRPRASASGRGPARAEVRRGP